MYSKLNIYPIFYILIKFITEMKENKFEEVEMSNTQPDLLKIAKIVPESLN